MQGLLATELVEDKIKKITLSVFLGQEKSGAHHNAQALTQPISLSPTTDESGAPLQCDTCRTTVKSAKDNAHRVKHLERYKYEGY